jgi:CheB methylesterase
MRGLSAGLEALDEVIGQLSTDLPASIFIVQHMVPENTGEALLHRPGRHKAFGCKLAEDGESSGRGEIDIAPTDTHLLVKETKLLVSKGARENRYRLAIDSLFRSAVTHGPAVIGVVLSGMLDDGTAGLIAIRKCGGVTIVQDPRTRRMSIPTGPGLLFGIWFSPIRLSREARGESAIWHGSPAKRADWRSKEHPLICRPTLKPNRSRSAKPIHPRLLDAGNGQLETKSKAHGTSQSPGRKSCSRLALIAADPVLATIGASRHRTTQTEIDARGVSLMR